MSDSDILTTIDKLEETALKELSGVDNLEELEGWRLTYLGRRGHLTSILRSVARLIHRGPPRCGLSRQSYQRIAGGGVLQ